MKLIIFDLKIKTLLLSKAISRYPRIFLYTHIIKLKRQSKRENRACDIAKVCDFAPARIKTVSL